MCFPGALPLTNDSLGSGYPGSLQQMSEGMLNASSCLRACLRLQSVARAANADTTLADPHAAREEERRGGRLVPGKGPAAPDEPGRCCGPCWRSGVSLPPVTLTASEASRADPVRPARSLSRLAGNRAPTGHSGRAVSSSAAGRILVPTGDRDRFHTWC